MKTPEVVTYKRITRQPETGSRVQKILKDGQAAAAIAGMLISRGNLLGSMAPMGIAWYASCNGMDSSHIILAACMFGTLFMNAGFAKLKYVIAMALFWAITKIIPEKRRKANDFVPLAAAGINLVVGAVAAFASDFVYYNLMICVFESAAVWGMCIRFGWKKWGIRRIMRHGARFRNTKSICRRAI